MENGKLRIKNAEWKIKGQKGKRLKAKGLGGREAGMVGSFFL